MSEHAPPGGHVAASDELEGAPDVFLSYAREDTDFVRDLHRRLTSHGRSVWVDWESIPHSAEWWSEVERGIESAAAFVFILSPDSVFSQTCARELAHGEACHSRIVPVICRDVDDVSVPKSLADRNWLFFREVEDPDEAFDALARALATDLEEERLRARLRMRAAEWEAGGRKRSRLLRGDELKAAEQWVATSAGGVRAGDRQYVLASRRGAEQFQRRTFGAVAAALVLTIGLSIVALVLRHQAVEQKQAAESRALAASSLLALSEDPELSLLLAEEAVREQDTRQARQALREALSSSHVRLTMSSPSGALWFAHFTPDEREVVTADGDGPARVFDADSGRLIRTLSSRRYRRPLLKAPLSADGSRLLLVPNIGPAVALDVSGRAPPVSLTDPSDGWFSDAVLAPDGRLAVTTTLHTQTARIFDAHTGAVLRTLPGNFNGVRLSDDGRVLALAGPGTVTTYDLTSGRPLATLPTSPASSDEFARLEFAPDGSLFTVTFSEVRRWNPVTGQQGAALRDRSATTSESPAPSLAFSQDGKWVVGASGPAAGVWNAWTGERRTEIVPTANSSLGTLTLSPNGAYAVSTEGDATARVWDAASGEMLTELRGVPGGIAAAEFDSSGRRVLTAGIDGTARIWDAGLGLPDARKPLAESLDLALARTAPGRWATPFYQGDNSVSVLDSRSGRRVFARRLPRAAEAVAFADRAAVMAVVYDRRPVQLYAWGGQSSQGSLRGRGAIAEEAILSPDGQRMMTSRGDVMTVWDAATREPVARLRHRVSGQSFSDTATAFSPDHRLLATVGTDGVVVLWRSNDGHVLARRRGEPSPEFNASQPVKPAFSADGKLFVAAGNWELQPSIRRTSDGQQIAKLTDNFNSVAFSPTAPLVVTDGASVWDGESGRRLLQLRNPPSEIFYAAFTPDGLRVVGDHRLIFSCDVCGSIDRLLDLARQRITRSFTAAERDRYLR